MKQLLRIMPLAAIALGLLAASQLVAAPAVHAQQNQAPKQKQHVLALDYIAMLKSSHSSAARTITIPATSSITLQTSSPKTYSFASADYPGATFSEVFDENASTIVGAFQFTGGAAEAFTLKGSSYELLVPPNSIAALAGGINAAGVIVGGYGDLENNVHGFIDNAGTFTSFDFPGANQTIGLSINASGEIAGQYADSSGNLHGFFYNAGIFTSVDFPGASSTSAYGIDTAGDVSGTWTDSSGVSHGFILSAGGSYTQLDFPEAKETTAFGLNDFGQVAGEYEDSADVEHGFVYSKTGWNTIDVPATTGTGLVRIENSRHIVGTYTDTLTESHGLTGH